ncbi:MAG: putative glycoside hydrolase [Candidatus Limivicinus sp.]|nr:putative glycoside hydrolase [Candidatus Limivicinus sp.]
MARVQEFYRGRRKRRNYAIIPFIVLLALFSLILVLFYGMQKYAVITKDGVSVELPILSDGSRTELDGQGRPVASFESVDVSIVFEEADYSTVEAVSGANVPEVRAIFVPAENVTKDKLIEYTGRLRQGNALVLEMKPRTGEMLWESHSQLAQAYGLSPATDRTAAMPELISMLKDSDVYLVAQISCLLDERLAASSSRYCIHTDIGANYRDDSGTWLDAYNLELRQWVAEMAQELYDMGFDEVVLADIAHPVIPEDQNVQLVYTRDISTPRSTVNAVCGFALSVADRLRDRTNILSIYVDTRTALAKPDVTNGQDARLFLKVYDRVYIKTDKFVYSYNVEDVAGSLEIGNVYDRLMPVVENYIPDNTSWVLVDVEEETTTKKR